MLKPMGKKILTILCSNILFILTYGIMEIKDPRYEGVFIHRVIKKTYLNDMGETKKLKSS